MKVDHIAVLVDNLDESQRWYEKYCDANLVFKDSKYRRMKVDNTYIALISKRHYEHAHIGVLVDSKDKFPDNGKVVQHRDGTTGCYLQDPDGNIVEYIYYSPDSSKKLIHD